VKSAAAPGGGTGKWRTARSEDQTETSSNHWTRGIHPSAIVDPRPLAVRRACGRAEANRHAEPALVEAAERECRDESALDLQGERKNVVEEQNLGAAASIRGRIRRP